MLKRAVKKCKRQQDILQAEGDGSTIVAQAYEHMIKSYERSILFLNAQRHI
jgi:hypothetical protein